MVFIVMNVFMHAPCLFVYMYVPNLPCLVKLCQQISPWLSSYILYMAIVYIQSVKLQLDLFI